MEFSQLRYFQMVARTENISKAAQSLYITQPNLSKSIARLERELGVPLFDHRKGKIILNDYGRLFLSSVNLAFDQLNTGVESIQRLYESNQNVLSLSSPVDSLLADVLKHFSFLHPSIGIRQFSYGPNAIVEHLLDRSLTLALISWEPKEELLQFDLLGSQEYVVLLHSGHPLARQESVWIQELSGENFICDSSRLGRKELFQLCKAQGFEPSVSYELESAELICQLLEGNAGIAFMPISQYAKIKAIYPDTQIRCLTIRDKIPLAILGIVYHKNYVFTQAAETFTAFLREWHLQEVHMIRELGYGRLLHTGPV
ncbi:MAG: LysR family transcriptional regulator [Oscillospiraceae bacterium]|nr:LysR family transcriptional regulator [Oscillospiraceae bacterium]